MIVDKGNEMYNKCIRSYTDIYEEILDNIWNKNIFNKDDWNGIATQNHIKIALNNNSKTNYILNCILTHDLLKYLALMIENKSNDSKIAKGKNNDILLNDTTVWNVEDTICIIPKEKENLTSAENLLKEATKIMYFRVNPSNKNIYGVNYTSVYANYGDSANDTVITILKNSNDSQEMSEVFKITKDYIYYYDGYLNI